MNLAEPASSEPHEDRRGDSNGDLTKGSRRVTIDGKTVGTTLPVPKVDLASSLGWVCLLGPLGVLCRYWLSELSSWVGDEDSSSVTTAMGHSHLFANVFGSLIMGFLVATMKAWGRHFPNVFAGLGVGFCGCLTTFSSWSQAGSNKLVDGYAFDWGLILYLGYASSYLAYDLGEHMGRTCTKVLEKLEPMALGIRKLYDVVRVGRCLEITFLYCFVGLSHVAFALGAIFHADRRDMWMSLLLCVFGVSTRFLLAKYKPSWLHVTIPTLTVNLVGSALLGLLTVFKDNWSSELNNADTTWGISAIDGCMIGTMGSLTTVSTFIKELHTLPKLSVRYVYGVGSVLGAQLLLLLINGPYRWST